MSLLHRQLRRALTEPELLLWDKLRNRKLGGFKFRRQQPIGPYIGDFVCLSPKLVVIPSASVMSVITSSISLMTREPTWSMRSVVRIWER